MPLFRNGDAALHYLDVGSGSPVVLLHAFPLSGEAFSAQVAALKARYRLLVPDLRGFGKSPPTGEHTDLGVFARDVFALMDHLGLPSAVIGGVSMGGYIAMAALREDAGRVRGLVLADTQATADDDAGKARRAAMAQSVLESGSEVLIQTLLPKLLADPTPPGVRQLVEDLTRQASPLGVAAAARGMGARPDSRDMLARFSGPALVVVGERDAVTPLEKATQMADLLADSTLVVIPGAGHLANQEAPESFNAALGAFLQRFSSGA